MTNALLRSDIADYLETLDNVSREERFEAQREYAREELEAFAAWMANRDAAMALMHVTIEDRSPEARDRMLFAMMELTEQMRRGYVESFVMHTPENADFDNYEISVSIRRGASSPERTT